MEEVRRYQLGRWQEAVADQGGEVIVLDGDPFKLDFAWAQLHLGEISDSDWYDGVRGARDLFARGEYGLADVMLYADRDVDELSRRKAQDRSRTRRNFERHTHEAVLPPAGSRLTLRPGGLGPAVRRRGRDGDLKSGPATQRTSRRAARCHSGVLFVFETIEFLLPYLRRIRTRLSSVRVDDRAVRYRNFPHLPRTVPLDDLDRFDWKPIRDGRACMLIRRDQRWSRVWGVDEDRGGDVTSLNNAILKRRRTSSPD